MKGGENMINSNKLKGRMRELQITQADLAAKLGLSPCTVSQKINNVRSFDLEEAEVVCNVLSIGSEEFSKYFFAQ